MQFYINNQILYQFTEDFRDLLEGIGITHLVNEGKFEDYILTFDIQRQELIRAVFSQYFTPAINAFILTPQILFPVSKEPDNANYEGIAIWEPKVCLPINCNRLEEWYNTPKALLYVFFNEHYAPYITRGLEYIKTGKKFVEQPI